MQGAIHGQFAVLGLKGLNVLLATDIGGYPESSVIEAVYIEAEGELAASEG